MCKAAQKENSNMTTTWQQLSEDFSHAAAHAGKSIVAVDGRSGHTSSGIIWRSDMILTAAHALRHDSSVGVIIGPERPVPAKLVGYDRGTDVAVLKLDQALEAPIALFGNTGELSIGDLVLAVARTRRGNLVASSGIIGGLRGEWHVSRTRIDQFIRPDLTLYPGFSGGALVAAGGGILGLNTSGLLRDKSITIPAATLVRIAEEIVAKGHVVHPYIGLVMQPVPIPESLQLKAGVTSPAGLLVMHVESKGPADQSGALLGDIVTALDGHAIDDLDEVHELLSQKGVGQDVQVTLIRGGQVTQLTIPIGERPRH
jgi:S1-C subfamily serine protease